MKGLQFLHLKSLSALLFMSGIFLGQAHAAASAPGAPLIGTATANVSTPWVANSTSATVTFTPPLSNGGAAITSYTLSCSPACSPVIGSASPITAKGLANGVAYTFTVKATNSVGTGPASVASNSAPSCQGSPQYVGDLEVFDYGTSGPAECNYASNGCTGYIGVTLTACNNGTGTFTFAYLLTGPSLHVSLTDMIYHLKEKALPVSFFTNGTVWGAPNIVGATVITNSY